MDQVNMSAAAAAAGQTNLEEFLGTLMKKSTMTSNQVGLVPWRAGATTSNQIWAH